MTFDARESRNTSGPSGFVFGGIVSLMAGCVFAAVFSLPQPSSAYAQQQALGFTSAQQFQPDLLSDTAAEYFEALERVAPEEHAALINAAASPLPAGQNVYALALDHGTDFLRAKADRVETIPTASIDAFLEETRAQLWIASHERHPLCSGQHYADILDIETLSAERINAKIAWLETQNPDVTMTVLTALIEAIEGDKSSPETREGLSLADEIALNGIGMSLAVDEQIASIRLKTHSAKAQTSAIRKVDACKLAATAISALKTLPQDTKGRAFGDAVQYFSGDDRKIGEYIFQTFF